MSLFLYRSRLQWEGYHGVAKHDGVLLELRSCPQFLPDARVVAVDYAPEVHVATVQLYAEPHRDMTPAESNLCRDLLERMARNARESLHATE